MDGGLQFSGPGSAVGRGSINCTVVDGIACYGARRGPWRVYARLSPRCVLTVILGPAVGPAPLQGCFDGLASVPPAPRVFAVAGQPCIKCGPLCDLRVAQA